MDTPPPNPPYHVRHPKLERRLHLVQYEEVVIAAQSRDLPDFHPYNSPHNTAVYEAVMAFEKIKPYLAEIDYYVLLHMLHDVSIEKIEEDYKIPISPEVIEKSRNTPEIREAYAILSTLKGPHEGTTRRNRADMLWRVAVSSEAKRPDISISAINALNKMNIDDLQLNPETRDHGSNRPAITLVVNNPALLKAPLDLEEATVVEVDSANG